MEKRDNQVYKTILVISLGFLVLFLVLKRDWLLYTSLAVASVSVISEKAAELITKGWDLIGKVLKLIVPNVILSLIFYLFLFPIALLWKLVGKRDALMLKNKYNTLFRVTNKKFDKASFEQPW